MAFDFGPSGRKTLAEIAKSPDKTKANLAKWALQSEDRWQLVGADKKIDVKKAEFEAKKIEGKVRVLPQGRTLPRSEEHTSELQSLMRTSYAVLCLQKNNIQTYID